MAVWCRFWCADCGMLTRTCAQGGAAIRRQARSLQAAAEDDTDTSQFENAGCVFIYTSAPAVMRFTVTNGDTSST